MGDLFAPTFVIAMFLSVFSAVFIIIMSEVFTKLRHLETLINEINEMLINIKQQTKKESKSPLTVTDIQVDRLEHGKCPICGNLVWKDDKKCKECGQSLKWDNEGESKNNS